MPSQNQQSELDERKHFLRYIHVFFELLGIGKDPNSDQSFPSKLYRRQEHFSRM